MRKFTPKSPSIGKHKAEIPIEDFSKERKLAKPQNFMTTKAKDSVIVENGIPVAYIHDLKNSTQNQAKKVKKTKKQQKKAKIDPFSIVEEPSEKMRVGTVVRSELPATAKGEAETGFEPIETEQEDFKVKLHDDNQKVKIYHENEFHDKELEAQPVQVHHHHHYHTHHHHHPREHHHHDDGFPERGESETESEFEEAGTHKVVLQDDRTVPVQVIR